MKMDEFRLGIEVLLDPKRVPMAVSVAPKSKWLLLCLHILYYRAQARCFFLGVLQRFQLLKVRLQFLRYKRKLIADARRGGWVCAFDDAFVDPFKTLNNSHIDCNPGGKQDYGQDNISNQTGPEAQ
jgi:hypothetical protein